MSEELIFHCDRSENHRLSYEKESGTCSDPFKRGWLFVKVRDRKSGLDLEVRKMSSNPEGINLPAGNLHFCSVDCLSGWFEKRIPKIEEEPEESQTTITEESEPKEVSV